MKTEIRFLWVMPVFLSACVQYRGSEAEPILVHEVPIDTGALIDVLPGEGAGAFVEYEGDGVWHAFVTCDTALSRLGCYWDVEVSLLGEGKLVFLGGNDLEPEDAVYRIDRGALLLSTFTTYDIDGFFFEAPRGETIRVETWLDGDDDPRYISWVGGGGLHRGAPSNPLDLRPAAP